MDALDSLHPPDAPAPSRIWTALAGVAVFGVGVALYARTLGFEFVNWDDPIYVIDNAWVQGLSWENLRAIFGRGIQGGYLPVHLLSYLVDHALWGLDPRGFHLSSLLLNALNGALALWVLLRLTGRPVVALLAALFFAVHPSHVSSVAWISARKELLSTAFLLLSTVAYLHARRDGGLERRAYLASLALFTLGGLSKATIVLYPLFFVLADRALDARLAPERRRTLARHLWTKLPYLAVALAVVAANWLTQVVNEDAYHQSLFTYALLKGHAAWRYLWLLLGLLPGQPIYDAPPLRIDWIGAAATLAPLVVAPALFVFAWRRRHHDAALALAWLGIGLAPAILFPLVTYMADRYLYAPSLGFCWLLALGIDALGARMRTPAWRALLVVVLTLLVWGRLFPVTWKYMPVWKDSTALWTYGMKVSDDTRTRSGLSEVLIEQERYRDVLELLPDERVDIQGALNRAIANYRLGRLDDAFADTDLARERMPANPLPEAVAILHTLRGRIHWKRDERDAALAEWREALRVDPGHAPARMLLDTMPRAVDPPPDPQGVRPAP